MKLPKMPPDLDNQAKRKWQELIGAFDVDVDVELLGNFCRQHSSLVAIRREKARLQKSGKFKTLVPGRDRTKVLNPLLVSENRLIASLNKMLKALGLSCEGAKREKSKRLLPSDQQSAMESLELVLCGLRAWNPQTKRFEDVSQAEDRS